MLVLCTRAVVPLGAHVADKNVAWSSAMWSLQRVVLPSAHRIEAIGLPWPPNLRLEANCASLPLVRSSLALL